MARTTVEDCIKKIPNHFELVLGVIDRARDLDKGKASELSEDNDRSIVMALREVAAGKLKIDLEQEVHDNLANSEKIASGETSISPDADPETESKA